MKVPDFNSQFIPKYRTVGTISPNFKVKVKHFINEQDNQQITLHNYAQGGLIKVVLTVLRNFHKRIVAQR